MQKVLQVSKVRRGGQVSGVRGAFRIIGGKGLPGVRRLICTTLEGYSGYDTFVDVYAGAANILTGMSRCRIEVLNDKEPAKANFYRVVQDPALFQEFIKRIVQVPYCKEVYGLATEMFQIPQDAVQWAVYAFTAFQQAWSGDPFGGWSNSRDRWEGKIMNLPKLHERLQGVRVENLDAVDCIRKYAGERTLCYADPPYIWETRLSNRYYSHEMTDEQHVELVHTLLTVPGYKVLSGYEHCIYEPLLEAGWNDIRINVRSSAGKAKGERTEVLYCSPR